MILSDREIRALCNYDLNLTRAPMLYPFSEAMSGNNVVSYGLTSGGYDLRLGHTVDVFKASYGQIISPKRAKNDPNFVRRAFDRIDNLKQGEVVLLPPHSYVLGYSLERIVMPRHLKGHCVGKSTLARCGIIINTTPLEPGWEGHLTLEIANVTPCPAEIYCGEGIAQLEFHLLSSIPDVDYAQKGGKYNNQGPEPVFGKVKE